MKINHGANLYDLSKQLGIEEKNLIDFSSNINPYGVSPLGLEKLKKNLHLASIYPDPDYTELKKNIAKYSYCKPENIILGGGATEIICATIHSIMPKRALLLSPCYSEYEKELRKIGCEIIKFFYSKERDFILDFEGFERKILETSVDMVVICNPNNPTGQLIEIDKIEKLLKKFNIPFMIDETYIEFTDFKKTSSFSLADRYENLIAIRGTSKFFSTPGIRLGYGVANGDILEKIKNKMFLWNINIFAAILGEEMFIDKEFIDTSKKLFKNNFDLLFNGLKEIKEFKIFESKSNFILCKILDNRFNATTLYDYLIKFGIIIRKAESFEGLDDTYFRVCILKEDDNRLLIEKIKEFLKTLK